MDKLLDRISGAHFVVYKRLTIVVCFPHSHLTLDLYCNGWSALIAECSKALPLTAGCPGSNPGQVMRECLKRHIHHLQLASHKPA